METKVLLTRTALNASRITLFCLVFSMNEYHKHDKLLTKIFRNKVKYTFPHSYDQ